MKKKSRSRARSLPRRPAVGGGIVTEAGTRYYRITDYDLMDPFFIALMGDGDLWMYLSSNGSLAAGRCSPEGSLFPYESVDKIHVRHGHTGPLTIVRMPGTGGGTHLWDPFGERGREDFELSRSVLKSEVGNEIVFEEINRSLGLEFRARWAGCDRYGWVRTCLLRNAGRSVRRVEVLDGVRNLLPPDLPRATQDTMSCLGDANKQSEYDPSAGLALYGMTAAMSDRPEANESMRAATAWLAGLSRPVILLSDGQIRAFRAGAGPRMERDIRGVKGAFLTVATHRLRPGGEAGWHQVFDTGLDHARVSALRRLLKDRRDRAGLIESEMASGTLALRKLLAGADAAQHTGDEVASVHHASNVLFNIARGGVPPRNYDVSRDDFMAFLAARNRSLRRVRTAWLEALPPALPLADLLKRAEDDGDPALVRQTYEYLPLVFSRRHGDPSRPWNHFAIRMKNSDGSPLYAFQGNWRDVFQNWEALCVSFPGLLESTIAKFVNATTVDGYNAYRISQEGIDWDVPNPADPGSNIGYWGDHQIVYLLKLLEASRAHHPGRLRGLLLRDWFCYADVPYDIKPHEEMVEDPHFTIKFNEDRARESARRAAETGSDGKLWHENGSVHQVNLAEKLLVPVLSKLSSLVPGGGVWMNTQRPEWNDANNALAGYGVSVVTLAYLRRHLKLLSEVFAECEWGEVPVSKAVVNWFKDVLTALSREAESGRGLASDAGRKSFLDAVGGAFSRYRGTVYAEGLGGRVPLGRKEIIAFLEAGAAVADASLKENEREDGLFHSYNILNIEEDAIRVTRLAEMLEGQVAILSSGTLPGTACAGLLDALRASALFRKDQNSYLLYPEKRLPLFLERNSIPESVLSRSPRLKEWLASGDARVVLRDAEGVARFSPGLANHAALDRALDALPAGGAVRTEVHEAYESVFRHRDFTGRSGTMYAYEGIRCIYWHMVAKLLLAVQECFFRARDAGEPAAVVRALKRHYRAVRAGLGFTKTPAEFGAFPLDAYSHTPFAGGAQQPGMTGQVKEEILARFGELGVRVGGGKIRFDPSLLDPREFLRRPAEFRCLDAAGQERAVPLKRGELAFTLCQVPVVYRLASRDSVTVSGRSSRSGGGLELDAEAGQELFLQSGAITMIEVAFQRSSVR